MLADTTPSDGVELLLENASPDPAGMIVANTVPGVRLASGRIVGSEGVMAGITPIATA